MSSSCAKCNEITITVHFNVTQWFLAIFMEHRLNTAFSVAVYCSTSSVVHTGMVLVLLHHRPNSGQLIYYNIKGFLCSIDTQNIMHF